MGSIVSESAISSLNMSTSLIPANTSFELEKKDEKTHQGNVVEEALTMSSTSVVCSLPPGIVSMETNDKSLETEESKYEKKITETREERAERRLSKKLKRQNETPEERAERRLRKKQRRESET